MIGARGYVLVLVCLLLAALWESAADERAWLRFSALNGCERIGDHDATYGKTLEGLLYRPAGALWRCAGGKLYWR